MCGLRHGYELVRTTMTSDHRKILFYLLKHEGEGAHNTAWIAEGCEHWYDTPWASSRLATLKRSGMVESPYRGVWRITELGKAAIA
jgi:hypothetical protein